jgi:hypothetical protein
MFKFENNSQDNVYPKTLLIHNTEGGAVWSVYHIDNAYQLPTLVNGAERNAFMYVTLEDYDPSAEETFPTWKEDMAKDYSKMFPNLLQLKDSEVELENSLYEHSAE